MTTAYYDRKVRRNTDGTPIYAQDSDRAGEDLTAGLLEEAWSCEVKPFGRLCAVDFYFLKHGRLVGVGELKTRSHDHDKFATVFLNVRKWLALQLAAQGMGVPALFIVRFLDQVRFINVSEVDASRVRMGGAAKRTQSHTDIEPVIEVPVADMNMIAYLPNS